MRDLAAALNLPERSIGVMSKVLSGKSILPETELELARALGILPPPRRVRRVSVAAIPRQAIRVCVELAEKFPDVYDDEAAAVLQWLKRIEQ